jgi:cholesterol transport system auxiliary component
MTHETLRRRWRRAALPWLAVFAAGCSALLPPRAAPPSFYALDASAPAAAAAGAPAPAASAPTLLVAPPQAAGGYDTRRIVYQRRAQQLEYFAQAEWVDTPARLLAPLLVAALAQRGAFGAVVAAPGAAAGDLRLDTTVLRLQQDFGSVPSRVRFTLRATLVDAATRRVIAVREFDASEASASEDAYGGVLAAQRVVQQQLQALARFCDDAARGWRAQP